MIRGKEMIICIFANAREESVVRDGQITILISTVEKEK